LKCYRANRVRLDAVIDRIVCRVRAYPPALRQLGREWLATLGPEPLRYHSAPDASPLLHLPIWMVEGRRGEGARIGTRRLDGILEATALLYFHTRIQDNVLDEPETRGQAPQLLLGNMFFFEAWQHLRGLSLSDRFWLRAHQAWQIFSDATEDERRQVQGPAPYSAALFRRHARKVALARIPLYAVTDGAQMTDKEAIDTFIDRLGQAYGLVNDVLGVERDLRAGMRTYLVATVEESLPKRVRRDPTALRMGLLRHPYLESFLEQAITLHRRIQPPGEALGISHMASYTKERIERIREHYDRAVGLRLSFALAGKAWPRDGAAAKHR
jgi:hypothetical protein